MKLITAIIPPERLEATKEELGKVKVFRLTIVDVMGVSDEAPSAERLPTAAERYGAPAAKKGAPRPFVKLMIACNEDFVEPTLRAIQRAADPADRLQDFGRALVLPLEECIRIRTGERGPAAI